MQGFPTGIIAYTRKAAKEKRASERAKMEIHEELQMMCEQSVHTVRVFFFICESGERIVSSNLTSQISY
jgi:hypothetical protein